MFLNVFLGIKQKHKITFLYTIKINLKQKRKWKRIKEKLMKFYYETSEKH